MGGRQATQMGEGIGHHFRASTRGEKYTEAKIAKLAKEQPQKGALELQSTMIRDGGCRLIKSFLMEEECNCEKLVLVKNEITEIGFGSLADGLYYNASIKELVYGQNKVGESIDDDKADALDTLSDTARIRQTSTKRMAMAIQENKTLESLTMQSNKMADYGSFTIMEAVKENTTLKSLSIVDNQLGEKSSKACAAMLQENKTLTSLNLDGGKMGDDACTVISNALEVNTLISYLNLRANSITIEGSHALGKAIEATNSIIELNLRRNTLMDEGCIVVAQAIAKNRSIRILHLSSNRIADNGMFAVADTIELETTIVEELYMDTNNIEDAGIVRFCEALGKNSKLKVLDLSMNAFKGLGYNRLADVVEASSTLKRVSISSSHLESKDAAKRIKTKFANSSNDAEEAEIQPPASS